MSALPFSLSLLVYAGYLPLALWLAIVDVRERRLPNRQVLALNLWVFLCLAASWFAVPAVGTLILFSVAVALLAGIGAVTLSLVFPSLLGMGDAKALPAVVALGAVGGPFSALAGFLWLVAMAGCWALLSLLRGHSRIPLGPALLSAPPIGAVLAVPLQGMLVG
ncbi:hypothetical protein KRX56_04875 [Dermabacteraceae bacterium TAE3-ERU27]|nr:hypothetical protein [Dermabacteraceae bacterium TAE3-ERU27]